MTENENLKPEESASVAETGSEFFLVKERYEIKFDAPLPQFNTNGAVAYKTQDKTNPQRELFALICDNNNPPRLSILPYLKSIDHPNVLKLVDFGVVDYPEKKTRNMALIYKQPTGPKVNDFSEDLNLKGNAEKFKSLLMSMLSASESLKSYNITHRALRLDNLFYKDSTRSEIVVGDCAASFPSLYQPAEYETVENLLCLPQGRGNSSVSCDVYAIAVVMINLLLGKENNFGLSTPELLHQKLKKGSYNTLLANEKIHTPYTAVLKGMLCDNPENRWNYLQVYNYLEGKAVSFTEGSERSMRSLSLGGEKYYTPKSMAIAMLANPDEALAVIKSGKLQEWIKNGLENEKLLAKIEKLITADKEKKESSTDLVSQICILLDNSLPIKCGDLYLFPDGLPKAVFYYLRNGLELKDFYALLSTDLIKLWYQEQPSLRAPANSNEFKIYINRKDYGYGIDRIMYDFDDDLPCTSQLVNTDFINSPSRLLKALDSNYQTFKEQKPFDRNIIAYLRCKMGKKIDGIITDLNSLQENIQSSAIIRLYSNIQNKYGPVQLHNLTLWILNITKPIIRSYHNFKYQKYLERELVKVAKSGKIIDLYDILENEEAKQKDRSEYSEALKEIRSLLNEKNILQTGGSKLDEQSRNLALRCGSIFAVLAMITSFIFSLIYWVVQ